VQGLIVQGQIGGTDHFDIARRIATEIFSIRCVCGFGAAIPDGVVGLDGLCDAGPVDHLAAIERERTAGPGPGAHLAVITWDVTADGFVPIARSHSEMIAGGLAVLLEGLLEQDTVILSTLIPSNFAAMAASLVPWLLVGGTLALHHPFDREAYDEQRKSLRAAVAIIPGPVVTSFAEAGQFATADALKRVLAIWRGPERLARAPVWRESAMLVDVQVFGEIGLIASQRMHDGNPALIALGLIAAPRVGNGLIVGDVQRTDKGTVTLRGPMVPRCAFPPGAERGHQPALKLAADGFVDTGYACKTDQNGALTVTGAPAGLIDVGGFRFVGPDMHEFVRQGEGGGALAVLPDALMGHRLAGLAADRARLHESLSEFGANSLLTAAFRSHRTAA
jgi:non-ribosomal peptide synthetase component E (peptide arylation enzyme)